MNIEAAKDQITNFKIIARAWFPYLSRYVYSLRPVPVPGMAQKFRGPLAVDKQGRLYFDPEFVLSMGLEFGAYVIMHEAFHLILRHCHRASPRIGEMPGELEATAWNIAVDLNVWEMLEPYKKHLPEGFITWDYMRKEFPGVSRNALPEATYEIVIEELRKQQLQRKQQPAGPGKGGSGKGGGEGQGNQPQGGSAADGIAREYEENPEPSWDSYVEDKLLAEVERAIAEKSDMGNTNTAKGRGHKHVMDAMRKVIRQKLRPAPNPWDCLRASASRVSHNSRGKAEYTYNRINRRQFAIPGLPRMKGVKRWQPKASVIVDTSGSMTAGCRMKAINVIQQGLRSIGDFNLVFGDTGVQADIKMSGLRSEVDMLYGGGTDMRPLIEYVEKKHNPDVIVVVTDGDTPWPARRTKAQLVVALTQEMPTPSWATRVRIPNDPNATELDP